MTAQQRKPVQQRKTILLYNHATNTGHHESWTALFASLLLQQQYHVVCMTPCPQTLRKILSESGVETDPRLQILELPPPTWAMRLRTRVKSVLEAGKRWRAQLRGTRSKRAAEKPFKVTLRYKWEVNAPLYAANAPEVQVDPEAPLLQQLKRRALHVIVPCVYAIIRLFPARQACEKPCPPPCMGLLSPDVLFRAADYAQTRAAWKPDFFFCMYTDIWLTFSPAWMHSPARMPPWGGLRFCPFKGSAVGAEQYLATSVFRGLCFLDEHAVETYGRAFPGKTFAFVPDITYAELPDCQGEVVRQLLQKAAGRPIVLLCGSIESRKNVHHFCNAALKHVDSGFFFAIVGQLQYSALSNDELDLLDSFAAMEHTFLHDVFFAQERDMNSVIHSAQFLFAAYKGFDQSSNMPSKAALFEKPILVSQGSLMHRRVEKYGIGLAIPEDDEDALLTALETLRARPVPPECYAAYQADFSEQQMAVALNAFFEQTLA